MLPPASRYRSTRISREQLRYNRLPRSSISSSPQSFHLRLPRRRLSLRLGSACSAFPSFPSSSPSFSASSFSASSASTSSRCLLVRLRVSLLHAVAVPVALSRPAVNPLRVVSGVARPGAPSRAHVVVVPIVVTAPSRVSPPCAASNAPFRCPIPIPAAFPLSVLRLCLSLPFGARRPCPLLVHYVLPLFPP